jgi:glycosyltransferase involved in cell wall biosynthesis
MNNQHHHILICDINIKPQGHYIGYNQYMLDEFTKIERNSPGVQISFLFNRGAEKLLSFNGNVAERVGFIDLKGRNSLVNRFLIIREIKKYTIANQIDHLLFMDFDQYQMPFYCIKFNPGISGILFRPHHRIVPPNRSLAVRILTGFRRFKKKISEKLIVGKSEIENIFILNDKAGVTVLNKIHNSSVFKYLPDPVFSYIHEESPEKLPEADTGIYRFLIFGSITERKNISNVIQAYDKGVFECKTELLIIGPCSVDYWLHLNDSINRLTSIDGNHKSIYIKRMFVTNAEMDYYFSISDVCLLIYRDFFGSSGLLGRSALHGLKVIGSNTGLLKELIAGFKLGLSVDPTDINAIARSLSGIMQLNVRPQDQSDFYTKHKPEKFLSTLAEFVTQ